MVDLWLTTTVNDGQSRYGLSKRVLDLHREQVGSFAEVDDALETNAAPIARTVVFAEAQHLKKLLADHGVTAHVEVAKATSTSSRGRHAARWALVGAGALGALITVAAAAGGLVPHSRTTSSLRSGTEHASSTGPQSEGTGTANAPDTAHEAAPDGRAVSTGNASSGELERTREQLVQQLRAATVILDCRGHHTLGFFATHRRIVTSAGAVCSRYTRGVSSSGRRFTAVVVWRDLETAIAVLQTEFSADAVLNLGHSDTLRLGDPVYLISEIVDDHKAVASAMVSRLDRVIRGHSYTQLDAHLEPSSLGGPLLNASGAVVGVVLGPVPRAVGIGFARPLDQQTMYAAGLTRPRHIPSVTDTLDSRGTGWVYSPAAYLTSARVEGRTIVVRVAYATKSPPAPSVLSFSIRPRRGLSCELQARADSWRLAGETDRLPPHLQTRQEREHGASTVLITDLRIDLRRCPRRGAPVRISIPDTGETLELQPSLPTGTIVVH